jgi:cell division transport system permease protein
MHARREEIEIMELVGASAAYVRGPFVAEGLLQGGIGAVVALLAVLAAHRLAAMVWGPELAAVFDGLPLRFLPVSLCAALVVGGMVVGSLGGYIASRRMA